MDYMLLIQEPVGQREARTEAGGHAAYDRMLRSADDLKARGILRGIESLASLVTAMRVTVREGWPQIVDGPFAEAKEMIGGFFLIDCATQAEAVEIARQCPAAAWCTVEVRSLGPCDA